MNDHIKSSIHVLIAIPYDWEKELRQFLEQRGVAIITALTRSDAIHIAKSKPLRGIIAIGEWAMPDKNNDFPGLIEINNGEIPSVTLVQGDGYRRFFEWYNARCSPIEEYCHIPFNTDRLWAAMKRVGMIEADD